MKRAAPALIDKGKKARRNLAFLGTCVSTARLLSDGAAWKAAKAAAASGGLGVICIKECLATSTLCIQGSVTAPPKGSKVAEAAHTHQFPGQAFVQLLVDTRSGELLDADTSCCPGGYHAARGSFCPCVGALLLAAAQLQSLEHGERQELALPHWVGTDSVTAQRHATHKAGKLQQLVQPGLLQRAPAQLLREVAEVDVVPAGHTQPKLHRQHFGYPGYYNPTMGSADTIYTLVPDPFRPFQQSALLQDEPCDLPMDDDHEILKGLLTDELAADTPSAAAAESSEGGQAGEGPLDQAQLLAALGGSHLSSYMGKEVPGWEQRPKVVNWAFTLLMAAAEATQPYRGPGPCSSKAASAGCIHDAKPLVALTGLVRVLWHCVHVDGLPVELRGVLLVAMALRNLLLVVALPVWARKAVAAQLRAWQQGISEAQACNPARPHGRVKFVHLLRIFHEAEQLCHHGWDHPSLSVALQPISCGPTSLPSDCEELLQQHPTTSSQLALVEEPGLVLLRLAHLEMLGQQAAYLTMALAGKQWNHAVQALLRSGNRCHLRLAAELLLHHITSLPQRLDYMQQLLGLEELPVVERCELAARLLLSLREDLVPRTHQPHVRSSQDHGYGAFWWEVQVWALLAGAEGPKEPWSLRPQVAEFVKEFLTLAGQAQFELAKASVTEHNQGPASAAATNHTKADTAEPATSSSPGAIPPHILAASPAEALAQLECLPLECWWSVMTSLQEGVSEVERLDADVRSELQQEWGMRWQVIWLTLISCHTWPSGVPLEHAPGGGPQSPTSPLELDLAMPFYGEPPQRASNQVPARIYMDHMGFVDGCACNDQGPIDGGQVEPFPLPNLLPLCGLAPAALHAVVEGAMAPLFDAAFCSSTTTRSTAGRIGSRPRDLGTTLLQVAGHPGVEYGGAAVRLQMAVEMVAYFAALTPLDDAQAAGSMDYVLQADVYQHLLYGLLAMGQQDLAWTVARAAYRVCPGRFFATFLLLLGIQRGYEAQAAAVDWILGKNWSTASGGAADGEEEDWLMAINGNSSPLQGASDDSEDDSSMDTQQLLGRDAADAIRLGDTASSRVQQLQLQQAAWARPHAPQRQTAAALEGGPAAAALEGGPAAADPEDGAAAGDPGQVTVAGRVRRVLRAFVDGSRRIKGFMDLRDTIEELRSLTWLPEDKLYDALAALERALEKGIPNPDAYGPDSDSETDGELAERIEWHLEQAVTTISRMYAVEGAGRYLLRQGTEPWAANRYSRPPARGRLPVGADAALCWTLEDLLRAHGDATHDVPEDEGAHGDEQDKPAASPALAATTTLESELLGVTGPEWRDRASTLRLLELQPVIQYTAVCGLHPDLVTRLALVELEAAPTGAATPPITWRDWLREARRGRGIEVHRAGSLPTPPSGETPDSALVVAVPGLSIQAGACDYSTSAVQDVSQGFAAWVVHWLGSGSQGVPNSRSSSASGSNGGDTSSGCCNSISTSALYDDSLMKDVSLPAYAPSTSGAAPLLRQLWLLLQGRCHTPWMLWLAAALDRAGEQQLACQAAAQGMLPSSCHFWDMISVKAVHAACFEALVPVLAQSGDSAILKQAATTQLLMAQQPVPVDMLLGEGVLDHLREVIRQLTAYHMPSARNDCLEAPASWIDMATGKLLPDRIHEDMHGCNLIARLMHGWISAPLPEQRQLHTVSSREEESVLAALEPAVANFHWSVGLGMVRAARDAGVIRSWPGLVRVVRAPLADAVEDFKWLSQDVLPSCNTLNDWASQRDLHQPVTTLPIEEAGGWVNGVLAWLAGELGAAASGETGTPPPLECVEELSSCLLGYYSPHMLLYVAAAMQALQGHSAAGITSSLIRNGVLPLVGRPENLQPFSAKEVVSNEHWSPRPSSLYWAWEDACYAQALQSLLQQEQLLASLPPATIRNMALTYWVNCATVEAMVWVGQLLDWLPQRSVGGLVPAAAGVAGLDEAGAGMEAEPALPGLLPEVTPEVMLSIKVHPELAPFLDLAPAAESVSQRAMLNYVRLQDATSHCDVLGALGALFSEPPEDLDPDAPLLAMECSELEEYQLELDATFDLLVQEPYAGSPAMRWLSERPQFRSMQQLLQEIQSPAVLSTCLAALESPSLQLRVLQYKLWKLYKAIRYGPPCIMERINRGPPKPWEQQLTEVQVAASEPSHVPNHASWAQLPDANLSNAFMAARAAIPGPTSLPRWQMVSTVLGWMEAQEVALAWAVVQYAELRGPGAVLLDELCALVPDPCFLGQLPVFMAHLGTAVKQQRTHYPLYALFRRLNLPKVMYNFVRQDVHFHSIDELRLFLNGYGRLQLQQLMVQAMPWLDWQKPSKSAEVNALAEWLWWLVVDARRQDVVGADVAPDVLEPDEAHESSASPSSSDMIGSPVTSEGTVL